MTNQIRKKITATFTAKKFMQIKEVNDKKLARDFLQVNVIINAGDPNYIRPLDKDINQVFEPKTNKALRHAEIIRWILVSDDGRLIGRIAAFANKKYKNRGDDIPIGGIGFFDCINDQAAATLLFDTAKDWLAQKGMQAMDGPINCGERDRWWGLLVEGFSAPGYCMNYNPPYYQQHFENYGFQNFYNQICFALKVKDPIDQKFFNRHATLKKNTDIRAVHIDKSRIEKFARDFTTVYNKAWAGHGGIKEMRTDMAVKLFKQMKPVMDEKIIWFVYHKQEPVAVWINIPDLNQWFKYLNGKFDLFAKLKFLWVKAFRKPDKFIGIVFGIVPEWQGTGMDSYIIVEGGATVIQKQRLYEDFEMQWIGEFNPKMINVAAGLGTYKSRRLVTYRYLFDRSKEFRRHPIIS